MNSEQYGLKSIPEYFSFIVVEINTTTGIYFKPTLNTSK